MRDPLDDDTIDAALADSAWERVGTKLRRTVHKADFAEALAYVNQIGVLAEEANHHPDICISWNRVDLELTTHSVGRLTQADVDLALRIDRLEQIRRDLSQ